MQEGRHILPYLLLFFLGLLIRVPESQAHMLSHQATRQYQSAMVAKTMMQSPTDFMSYWNGERGAMEPPVVESLTVSVWKLLGTMDLRVPRVLSGLYWVAGFLLFFHLVKRVMGEEVAFFASLFCLLFPFGVLFSLHMQPEPLMFLFLFLGLNFSYSAIQSGNKKLFFFGNLFLFLAVLIRPLLLFPLFGFCLFLLFPSHRGFSFRSFLSACVPAFLGVFLFFFYKIFIGAYTDQAGFSFQPRYWTEYGYYRGWAKMIKTVFGYLPVFLVAVSLLFVRGRTVRFFGLMFFSYLLYGLLFNHHIHTHDYYQIIYLPVFALALGIFAKKIKVFLNERLRKPTASKLVPFLLIVTVTVPFVNFRPQPYWNQLQGWYEEIGTIVGENRSVALSYFYANPLCYHSDADLETWPHSYDRPAITDKDSARLDTREKLNRLVNGQQVRYFIVTDFRDFHRQPELKELLESQAGVIATHEKYKIYDLSFLKE